MAALGGVLANEVDPFFCFDGCHNNVDAAERGIGASRNRRAGDVCRKYVSRLARKLCLCGGPASRDLRVSCRQEPEYALFNGRKADWRYQSEEPAKQHKSNWLPVPKAPFNLFIRAYLPGQDLIDQSYVPPAVHKVK